MAQLEVLGLVQVAQLRPVVLGAPGLVQVAQTQMPRQVVRVAQTRLVLAQMWRLALQLLRGCVVRGWLAVLPEQLWQLLALLGRVEAAVRGAQAAGFWVPLEWEPEVRTPSVPLAGLRRTVFEVPLAAPGVLAGWEQEPA